MGGGGTIRRVLFATFRCYLDDSNGAAVASRAMMECLARRGFAAEALTGTVLELRQEVDFDGELALRGIAAESHGGETCSVDPRGFRLDVPPHYRLTHRGVSVTLCRSRSTRPHPPDPGERDDFLRLLGRVLDRFRPDVVVNYGGDLLAHEVRTFARARGAAVVFALHNFSYPDARPFATADAVIVPSRFAADHYRQALGLGCHVLPYLIDFDRVRAVRRDPKFLTFINPLPAKGVYPFARIADELGRRRPDILTLIVESRGTAAMLLGCGLDLQAHGNLYMMPQTGDPRHFWGATRVCAVPSLWWESQGLVAVEAMINGVPVLASDRGALPETLGGAGVVLPLPGRLTPETRELPTPEEVAPWVEAVIRFWDDAGWYAEQSRLASTEAQRWAPEALEPRYAEFFANVRRR